jgi:hypothetical protein
MLGDCNHPRDITDQTSFERMVKTHFNNPANLGRSIELNFVDTTKIKGPKLSRVTSRANSRCLLRPISSQKKMKSSAKLLKNMSEDYGQNLHKQLNIQMSMIR